jgi:hypothetical protein
LTWLVGSLMGLSTVMVIGTTLPLSTSRTHLQLDLPASTIARRLNRT